MAKLVKATREGLSGRHTSTGLKIDRDGIPFTDDDWFVALPDTCALHRIVRVTSMATGESITAPVLDVGPWNEHDCEYVHGPRRPAAEHGIDTRGRKTNGAGIDLSDGVWKALRMPDNGLVEWEFVT